MYLVPFVHFLLNLLSFNQAVGQSLSLYKFACLSHVSQNDAFLVSASA